MADFKDYPIWYKEKQSDQNFTKLIVKADSSAEISYSLMEEPILQLKSQMYGADIPMYKKLRPFLTKIDTHSGTFYLTDQPKITKISSNNYTCEMVFKTDEYRLAFYRFKDADGRITFSLTMRPQEYLEMIVGLLNSKDSGWTVGEYPQPNELQQKVERTASFDRNTCREALKMIADIFNTEFEIVGKKISLKKVVYYENDPYNIRYGEKKGLLSEIVVNSAGTQMVEILFAHGGTRNIDASANGGISHLLLPKNYSIWYNGTDFQYPPIFIPQNPPAGYREYSTDKDGTFIKRTDVETLSGYEDTYVSEDIYPHRIGEVTHAIVVNAASDRYDFRDATIPSNLDFSKYRIDGETVKIKFESGKLAGREFDIVQNNSRTNGVTGYTHSDANYSINDNNINNNNRRFRLVAIQEDGQTFPNQTICMEKGDLYAVFGIRMPSQYIADNTNKTGASWDLFREAAEYLYDKENGEVTVQMKLDPVYSTDQWSVYMEDYVKIGAFYLLKDDEIVGEDLKVRVLGIKQNLFYKEKVELFLSNTYLRKNYRSEIDKTRAKAVVRTDELNRQLNGTATVVAAGLRPTAVIANDDENTVFETVNEISIIAVAGTRISTLLTGNIDFVWTGTGLKPLTGVVKLSEEEKILSITPDNQVITSLSVNPVMIENEQILFHSIVGSPDATNNVIGMIPNDWISINIQATEEPHLYLVLTNAISSKTINATFMYRNNDGVNFEIDIHGNEFSVEFEPNMVYFCRIVAFVRDFGRMQSKEYIFKSNR